MFNKYRNRLKNRLRDSLPKTIEATFLRAEPPKGLFGSCKIFIMINYDVKEVKLFGDDVENIQSYRRRDSIKIDKGFFNDYRLNINKS